MQEGVGGGVVGAAYNKVVMVVEAKHHIIHVGEWWELLIIRWLWLWKLSITLSMWVSGDELVLTVINSFVPAKVFLVV